MLSEVLREENYRLERHEVEELHELCTDMYKSIGSMQTSFSEFVDFGDRMKKLGIRDGSVSPNDLPMVDNVRERLNEFGIEVTDEEQKRWQHSDD